MTAALVSATAFLSSTASAALYRWVDESGEVHYSDRLPPDAVLRAHEVYNADGERIDAIPAPKTEEEKAAEAAEVERLREIELAEQKAKAEQERHDRMLLQTFTSVEEMELARTDRRAAIQSQIDLVEAKLKRLREDFDRQKQRVEALEKQGKPVPQQQQENLETTRQSLMDNETFLQERRMELEEFDAQFEADIARFKELKEEQAARGR